LACTLVNLANLCNQQRNFAAAKGYLDQAQPHHQAALKANPQHPTYRQFYHDNLMALVQAQAGLLDPAAAVQAAQTLCDLDWGQPDNTYDAARALAMCIPIVEKHEKLDPEQRKAAVQFYGDEAMKLLRDAVAKGFTDAARMQEGQRPRPAAATFRLPAIAAGVARPPVNRSITSFPWKSAMTAQWWTTTARILQAADWWPRVTWIFGRSVGK
jgi:hypothetical protein